MYVLGAATRSCKYLVGGGWVGNVGGGGFLFRNLGVEVFFSFFVCMCVCVSQGVPVCANSLPSVRRR